MDRKVLAVVIVVLSFIVIVSLFLFNQPNPAPVRSPAIMSVTSVPASHPMTAMLVTTAQNTSANITTATPTPTVNAAPARITTQPHSIPTVTPTPTAQASSSEDMAPWSPMAAATPMAAMSPAAPLSWGEKLT